MRGCQIACGTLGKTGNLVGNLLKNVDVRILFRVRQELGFAVDPMTC